MPPTRMAAAMRNCFDMLMFTFLSGSYTRKRAVGPFRVAAILLRITRRPVRTRTVRMRWQALLRQRQDQTVQLAIVVVTLPDNSRSIGRFRSSCPAASVIARRRFSRQRLAKCNPSCSSPVGINPSRARFRTKSALDRRPNPECRESRQWASADPRSGPQRRPTWRVIGHSTRRSPSAGPHAARSDSTTRGTGSEPVAARARCTADQVDR